MYMGCNPDHWVRTPRAKLHMVCPAMTQELNSLLSRTQHLDLTQPQDSHRLLSKTERTRVLVIVRVKVSEMFEVLQTRLSTNR